MTYNEFINNILVTRGRFNCGDEYCERHHIQLRSCGGSDDEYNLIDLYAKEHFIAHKLLAEENPDNSKAQFAFWIMSTKSHNTQGRYECTAEEYEEAKQALAKAQSEAKKEMFKDRQKHPMFGHKHSDNAKNKMSIAKKGKESPKKGIPLSEEQRQQILASKIGSKWSNEQHEKMDGRYANGNSTCCVPIYCPELDEYFWGLQEACDKYGFTKPNLSKCLNGERKHSGKHPITGELLTWVKLEK